ncbi:MAG TPA: hypothetical protein VNU68_08255 [Verrucomicrobiae bacterium]|nr:hypothetical protein [Verrucomicrobiae bacterium]
MHDFLFASGLWTGFYTYPKLPEQHPMELRLQFNNGTVSGDGTDGVGPFVIHGTYNSATGSARWIKTYTGSHDVHYEGTLDGTGLNGTWNIASLSQGTFRIWPRHLGNGEHG